MSPRGKGLLSIAIGCCLTAVLVVMTVAGCGGDGTTDTNTSVPPGPPVVEGKQGDADVMVVYVRVDGIEGRVPCVLYNGYRSVAIDCLDPRVP